MTKLEKNRIKCLFYSHFKFALGEQKVGADKNFSRGEKETKMPKFLDVPSWYDEQGELVSPATNPYASSGLTGPVGSIAFENLIQAAGLYHITFDISGNYGGYNPTMLYSIDASFSVGTPSGYPSMLFGVRSFTPSGNFYYILLLQLNGATGISLVASAYRGSSISEMITNYENQSSVGTVNFYYKKLL